MIQGASGDGFTTGAMALLALLLDRGLQVSVPGLNIVWTHSIHNIKQSQLNFNDISETSQRSKVDLLNPVLSLFCTVP